MAARYTLIKGVFPIVGTEPDGDTIRFQPDNPAFVSSLGPPGQAPGFSRNGTQISVRFEGIDALETHFQSTRQQAALGDLATADMLAALGFRNVATAGTKVTAATPPSVRGHVFANSLDSFGRMIAFVFAGEAAGVDGATAFLDTPTLATSVNAQLLALGVVYPAFYSTLPVDLKDNLAAQTRVIRERGLGLWPQDAPSFERAAAVPDLAAAEALVMWPKLFRRLVVYFRAGNTGLAGFDAWLRADQRNRDDFLMLPTGELGNMHDLVEVTSDRLQLRFRPEDIVVLPDSFADQPLPQPIPVPVPEPAPLPEPAPHPDPTPGVPDTTPALRIVAALVNPTGNDAGHETVTLLNVSAAPVSLTGWELRDRKLLAAGSAGQRLEGTLAAGDALRVMLRPPMALRNSGDNVVLVDPTGRLVQKVSYSRAQSARSGMTVVF